MIFNQSFRFCSLLQAPPPPQMKPRNLRVRVIHSLNVGDHIFCYKRFGCYSHHGIYVGNGKVIHFTRTRNQKLFFPWKELGHRRPCMNCGPDTQSPNGGDGNQCHRGVIITCTDCFRRDGSKLQPLHLYVYGVPAASIHRRWFSLTGSGSCTTAALTKSPTEVVQEAHKLLQLNNQDQGFGEYDLIRNNCEHFATFCSTGIRISEQTAVCARLLIRLNKLRRCHRSITRSLFRIISSQPTEETL